MAVIDLKFEIAVHFFLNIDKYYKTFCKVYVKNIKYQTWVKYF